MIDKLKEQKDKLRLSLKTLKEDYTQEHLLYKSEEVISVLEITGVFQEAKHIFIYNAMPDEVQTMGLINRWNAEKTFYFPVTFKDKIVFRKYFPSVEMAESKFGILEPKGNDITDFRKIDLVVVPGVAFDRKMNRMGRGKGYYDRFLPSIKAPKVGICFDFQLLDSIPNSENDVKMDYIVSENDLIW